MTFLLHRDPTALQGHIHLDGSKSISNRALTIRALSGQDFPLENLSTSQDTQTMMQLLQQREGELDVGPAGTTFRFLTAYLSIQPGTQVLTGSARMKQRPHWPISRRTAPVRRRHRVYRPGRIPSTQNWLT